METVCKTLRLLRDGSGETARVKARHAMPLRPLLSGLIPLHSASGARHAAKTMRTATMTLALATAPFRSTA
jgi:hypothetical protein